MTLRDAIAAVEDAIHTGTAVPPDALRVVLDAAERYAAPCSWCSAEYAPQLHCTNCGREHT